MKENDYISRKQTIERLKLNFPISQGADNSRDRHRYMQAMADIQAIREMPSVTPQEPRKGHWIEYTRVLIPEPFNKWEQAWYCSECGYGNQESDESAWLEWNYCPKCGAKMEVEDGNGKRK